MRAPPELPAFSTALVLVFALAGCPASQPAPREQETPADPTHSSKDSTGSQDVDTSIVNVGMDLLAKLGYDTSTLEVISMELSPIDYSLVWNVRIGNEFGEVASFYINEKTLRFESLNCVYVREGVLAPLALSADHNLQERIAEALDLEAEGYRFAVEKEAAWEYRKYATWNEWEIAVSEMIIVVPPEEDVPILLDWHESELVQPVRVNIDRDGAVSAASSYVGDPGAEPSRVELIQLPSEPYGPSDFSIYWEVLLGDQVVHVRADNGTIRNAAGG